MKAVVVCSGGLDSVTLAHRMAHDQSLDSLISFDYGQTHKKELGYAAECAQRLGVSHRIVDLRDVGALLNGSALTGDAEVPEGHYAEDNMRVTIVPNRNAIMLAIAFGYAAARKADAVATAVHGGDHFIYPDCRPDFAQAFEKMQSLALDGYARIALLTPYIHSSKADIVADGAGLDVPFSQTWSCYKGEDEHCGRCGTCVERLEAFAVAGVEDPTRYQDTQFWRSAVKSHAKQADKP